MSEKSNDPLVLALGHVSNALKRDQIDAEEFDTLVDQVKTLVTLQILGQNADVADAKAEREADLASLKLKHEIEMSQLKERVSVNTWVTVGANLAGILLILNYEHLHVAGSKALGLLWKLKTH